MTMKLVSLRVLTAATIASAAVVPPPLPLNLISNPTTQSQSSVATLTPSLFETPNTNLSLLHSDFPEEGFKVAVSMGASLIPVNSALMNVLFFMGLVAGQGFTQELQPRTYSTPGYRDVVIISYAWTEARFLIWGVYFAANFMIKNARFHEMKFEFFWEDKFVGKMKIAARQVLGLTDGASQDLAAQLDAEDTGGNGSVVGNLTNSDLATPILNASAPLSLPSGITITFEAVVGASRLARNDVFMTSCAYSQNPFLLSLELDDELS